MEPHPESQTRDHNSKCRTDILRLGGNVLARAVHRVMHRLSPHNAVRPCTDRVGQFLCFDTTPGIDSHV